MKLNYDRKSKNPTYFIQMGIRNGKKVTTKNIVRIGKHDDLLKITDDPLAYAKQKVLEYNQQLKEEKVELNVTIDFSQKIINSSNDIISRSLCKNIGYLFLKRIYSDLQISDFFKQISETRRFKFDADQINMVLTIFRILHPGSKLYTLNHLHELYGSFDIDYQHIERFLDILNDNYDLYLSYLFDKSNNIVKRNTDVCYFDCTNFYFEKEYEDEDIYDEVTREFIKGLLKYGCSKEHRPNPIVQMGLFMDGDSIPLTMCINSGSNGEPSCAVPTETKMLDMFKNKDIIYCSDAGLGYTDIRVFNSFKGRKFIVTQSIKKLSEVLQQAVFNDFEYRFSGSNEKMSLEWMQTFDRKDPKNRIYYDGYIYKFIPVESLVDVGLSEIKTYANGNQKKVKSKATLKQRTLVTYSRKMAEYQKAVRGRQVERAKELLKEKDPEARKKGNNDVKRFIKTIKDTKTRYELDTEKIEQEAKYDGFYAIATNIFDKSEKEIQEIVSQRYRIEECFRILKTHFESRPVFHYTPSKIRGHFLVCYTALLIYRLLEVQLDRQGIHFTTEQILETLRNMEVVECDSTYYQACYTGSNVLDSMEQLYGLGLNKKYYQPSTLNKIAKKVSDK